MHATIYKITPETLWRTAEIEGRFTGAPVDLSDGFDRLLDPRAGDRNR